MSPDDQRPIDAETALADSPAGHKDDFLVGSRELDGSKRG